MKTSKEQGRKGELLVQAARLVDFVDYQKGSVVSRTIIDKKAGTVTLFAFDEGEGLASTRLLLTL
jgi:hypothetical protein